MEILKAELKKKLDKISQIYIFTQEIYLYTEYFYNPNTQNEFMLLTNSIHSTHLRFISHIMFRTLIIEISKLYSHSDSDKYRLESFIISLAKNGHFRKINFPNDKVEKWKKQLELDTNKNIIDELLQLRSKVYAHTDDLSNLTQKTDVTFEKIKSLLDLALDIIKSVFSIVFNTHFDEESSQFDKERFLALKILAKGEALRQDEIYNQLI